MTKKQIQIFLTKLEGPEGCHFREDKKGPTWKCDGDKSLSKKILKKMNIDDQKAKRFLSRCEKLGGYCDCEIIFNAADHLL